MFSKTKKNANVLASLKKQTKAEKNAGLFLVF